LTGLHQVNINSFEDLLGALNFGSSIRQTDATAINAKSSRSHAVFSLNLVQRKSPLSMLSSKEKRLSMPVEALSGSDASVTIDSKLHFVDLAGSERLKNTGASGERAKEGISINAGLASLGKVISQLSSRQSGAHVSYRDSKLTRLLQDSLGGNAITYMIACVTPAEFHLSETLNTVQYAQRARAIQSKPRIQQVTDESDKQAMIERLKAEIAFLRQQIRSSEGGDRKTLTPQDRGDRPNEREIELQNQVLDVQESYTALSQRHARLISEITKTSDLNGETNDISSIIGNSSVERLQRSHSFAESVEQVVLEYEKTIQSLESSLSKTRASLANTESSLLERETKCACVERVNVQLQARVHKMMEREANTENYLHDLEAKLDGRTSGEEKNAAIAVQLQKEIARARENEAGCEDYISTLEERLAEADQDMELMQREINRLEHVVDRQRSLGKLDNLLHELDNLKQNGVKHEEITETPIPEITPSKILKVARTRGMSLEILAEAVETAIPESDDDFIGIPAEIEEDEREVNTEADSELGAEEEAREREVENHVLNNDYAHSPAQSKFVAEKLDSVTQELFDLRMQHEVAINDYDLLAAKYEEALRTLGELRDAVDESHHPPALGVATPLTASRPASVLEDQRVHELKNGYQELSSQSLSLELSLAGESTISQDASNAIPNSKKEDSDWFSGAEYPEVSAQELESTRKLLQEHQEGMMVVAQKYAQLQAEHEETLGLVEELRMEVQKSRSMPSPTSPGPPVIRRMASQNLMSTVDRAHRSLAALRNIAVEEFEDRPETMQNFEFSLNAAMHELHTRMERIQSLEAENMSVKKEMETKSTIISGLTRERSSLQGASPVDMSIVSQMRGQIVQQEDHIKELEHAHNKREKELLAEVQNLTKLAESQAVQAKARLVESEKKIEMLQGELSEWQRRQHTAVDSLQSSQRQLQTTKAELEAALASMDAIRSEYTAVTDASAEKAIVAKDLENERVKQQALVESLKGDIEVHESKISRHLDTIAELENSNSVAQQQLAQLVSEKEINEAEIEAHRCRISDLEREIGEQNAVFETYEVTTKEVIDAHAEDYRSQISELERKLEAQESAQISTQAANDAEIEIHRAHISELERAIEAEKSAFETYVTSEKAANEAEHEAYQSRISTLEQEIETQKKMAESYKEAASTTKDTGIAAYLSRICNLEREIDVQKSTIESYKSSKAANDTDIDVHRGHISDLENQINSQKSLITSYEADLESLLASHQAELEQLETRAIAAAETGYELRLAEQNAKHEDDVSALRSEICDAKDEVARLLDNVSTILNTPITPVTLSDHIRDLLSEKQRLAEKYSELFDANEEILKQLEMKADLDSKVNELTEKAVQHETKVTELAHLAANLEETVRQKEELIQKKDATLEEITVEKQKSVRLVEELEEQITNTFDQHHNRLSVIQQERHQALEEANVKIANLERDIETYRVRIEQLELQIKNSGAQEGTLDRTSSLTSNLRKSSSTVSLPSPPPAIPLPPLPSIASTTSANAGGISPPSSRHTSKELVNAQLVEDQEARIRTIEKHLYAEKQLTATLEEALGDLEAQSNKIKTDMEAWKKKAWQYEDELQTLRKERNSTRLSLQAVEEERNARREAEAARANLEERMNAINKKKKKSTLNCF
jgi:kinesin family protein 4/21/27